MVLNKDCEAEKKSAKRQKFINPQQQIVKRSQIHLLYPISRSTSYRWEDEGKLEPAKEFGPRCKGWTRKYLDKVFGLTE